MAVFAAPYNRFNRAYQIDPIAPRGLCVVIDVLNKSKDDIVSIQRTFKELNFIFVLHQNLTATQIITEAKKYSTIDHTNFYCFVGIVLAPVNAEGDACDSEGVVIDVKTILEGFCQNKTLEGKPKVFLFQKIAERREEGGVADTVPPLGAALPRRDLHIVADTSDLLVCRFTVKSEWNLQTTFFQEFHEVPKLLPFTAVLKKAKESFECHLHLTGSANEFDFHCFDRLDYDLHLPPKGIDVSQRQVKEDALVDPTSDYPMSSNIKGYCIIVNNLGSEFEQDCQLMQEVFRNEIGFHVESFVLLSSQAIDELLKALSKIDHTRFNALVVALYVEGDCKAIKGCGDGGQPLAITDIENNFTYENCPTLSSKPKLFIFNLKKPVAPKKRQKRPSFSFKRRNRHEQERLVFTDPSNDPSSFSNSKTPDVFYICNVIDDASADAHTKRFSYAFTKAIRRSVNRSSSLDQITAACIRDGLVRPTIGRTIKFTLTEEVCTDDYKRSILAAELKMSFAVWQIIRKRTIVQIITNKDKLATLARDVRISRVAGASAGIVGGAIAVTGFILLPFTFGGSILVSGAGAGLAAAGGLMSIGATIYQKVVESKELKKANSLLAIDNQLSQIIHSLMSLLQDEAERLSAENPGTSPEQWLSGILRSGEAVLRVGSVGAKGAFIGVQLGLGALEGSAFVARIGAAGLTAGFAVVGGVLNLVLLPVSIVELIVNIHGLAKEKKTSIMEVLEDLAQELHKSLAMAEGYIEQSNDPNHVDTNTNDSKESDDTSSSSTSSDDDYNKGGADEVGGAGSTAAEILLLFPNNNEK